MIIFNTTFDVKATAPLKRKKKSLKLYASHNYKKEQFKYHKSCKRFAKWLLLYPYFTG